MPECCVCFEETKRFTICNHCLCRNCYKSLIDDSNKCIKVCPICRKTLLFYDFKHSHPTALLLKPFIHFKEGLIDSVNENILKARERLNLYDVNLIYDLNRITFNCQYNELKIELKKILEHIGFLKSLIQDKNEKTFISWIQETKEYVLKYDSVNEYKKVTKQLRDMYDAIASN